MTTKLTQEHYQTTDADGNPLTFKIHGDKPVETMTVIANSLRQIYFKNRGTERNPEMVQFTGFDDAQGNNIFEGDIVELNDEHLKEKPRGKITFDDGAFGIDWYPMACPRRCPELLERYALDELKVIGNIFQNPELL